MRCQKIMFSSVSHEFRTPLNWILNSYYFIKSSWDLISDKVNTSPNGVSHTNDIIDDNCMKIARYIKMGSSSSNLLVALVEDILNLSKMDAGNFSLNVDSFSIKTLIDEVYDLFIFQWKQKKLEFVIDFDKSLTNINIISDKLCVRQVLLNLLSNATKFTFEGMIKLSIKLKTENNNTMLQFKVEDSGIGIKSEDQDKLFVLFGMMNKQTDAFQINSNGWGIGLTVSKKYIQYLEGDIYLKSTYGVGTQVVFHIPYEESKHELSEMPLSDWDGVDINFESFSDLQVPSETTDENLSLEERILKSTMENKPRKLP